MNKEVYAHDFAERKPFDVKKYKYVYPNEEEHQKDLQEAQKKWKRYRFYLGSKEFSLQGIPHTPAFLEGEEHMEALTRMISMSDLVITEYAPALTFSKENLNSLLELLNLDIDELLAEEGKSIHCYSKIEDLILRENKKMAIIEAEPFENAKMQELDLILNALKTILPASPFVLDYLLNQLESSRRRKKGRIYRKPQGYVESEGLTRKDFLKIITATILGLPLAATYMGNKDILSDSGFKSIIKKMRYDLNDYRDCIMAKALIALTSLDFKEYKRISLIIGAAHIENILDYVGKTSEINRKMSLYRPFKRIYSGQIKIFSPAGNNWEKEEIISL